MINLNELLWIGLLTVILSPFISAFTESIASSVGGWLGRHLEKERKQNKPLGALFIVAGILSWFLGDGSANYNLPLVILGYILFFLAYTQLRKSK